MLKLNILVLHQMGDPRYRREAVRSLEYMIPECRPELNCVVHDADLPFPEYLKDIDYHLIVLGPTFLCKRHNLFSLEKDISEYNFIKHSQACKVALPQDDYDASAILDQWLFSWDISRIYPVCSENWEMLYPKLFGNAEFKLGYTGYIDDAWIDAFGKSPNLVERKIDVSYRTHDHASNRCYLRNLKYVIADRFKTAITNENHSLILDISNDSKSLIPGSEWHKFLENSKFCLVTPSGSSLHDPNGDYGRCVNYHQTLNRNFSYEQAVKKCYPGHDKLHIFTTISPRNIEAALAGTVQIATPGSYSGLMSPMQDYLPLNEDCSNISDIVRMMTDDKLVFEIQKNVKEKILSEKRLRRRYIVNEIVEFAQDYITKKNFSFSNQEKFDKLFLRYQVEKEEIAKSFWKKKRILQKIKKAAIFFGAKKVQVIINRKRVKSVINQNKIL
jgi:hypothetical protein